MIYVLGSINTDLVFNVNRIPKGGETMHAESYNEFCGGKGANQAVAIAKLGGGVKMLGAVGSDGFGKTMINNLVYFGADASGVIKKGADSGLAAILVENGENRIILSGGANMRIDTDDVDKWLGGANAGDILLMQLEIPPFVVEYALKKAKSIGMTTVLNPAPAKKLSPAAFECIDIITPNESETELLTGINPVDIVHTALCVKDFYKKGVKRVIITLGSRGAAVSDGMEITEIPPEKVKPVDTTAAGDTFVGAMLVKLSEGWDIVKACRYASVASSITIQRPGAAVSIPTGKEVDEAFSKK